MKGIEHRGELDAGGFRFAVVVSRWNDAYTSRLLDGAQEALAERGASDADVEVFEVPGAFELPLACLKAAEIGNFDAVIALGLVLRGETPHFDFVAGECAKGLAQSALTSGVPVAFGVLTTDSIEQAIERAGTKAGNKGADAAMAALEMVSLYGKLG